MKTSVIFPAKNEETIIETSLLDVYQYLKGKKYNFEILVVVNGSSDDTGKIVKELARKQPQIKLIRSKPGYGHALRKGLLAAKGEYIVIYNVDFYDLNLIDLIDINLYGKDLIIGSKKAPWSIEHRSFHRKAVSSLFNLYLKLFHKFRGSDTHGIKLIKKSVADGVMQKCRTYSGIFDTELVIRVQHAGYKIADFPVEIKEVRPSRFVNRLLDTPKDILELHNALRKTAEDKELFYNTISDSWDKKINNNETEKRLKVVFDELFSDVSFKNKSFLEIDCGLGYFSQEAEKRGAKVTGVDVGKNLIEICSKKMPEQTFIVASGSDLPFKDKSFDIILCTEVIEHVADHDRLLSEIARVAKPNAKIVLTTPNKIFKPLFDLLSLLHIRPYHGNEKWFMPTALKSKLVNQGLEIKKERYFNFICPHPILDKFEKLPFSKFITINQGYLMQKK